MLNGGSSGQGRLGDHPAIVLISAAAALITIIIFVTGRQYLGDIVADPRSQAEIEKTIAAASEATVRAQNTGLTQAATAPAPETEASNTPRPNRQGGSTVHQATPDAQPQRGSQPVAEAPSPLPKLNFGPRGVIRPLRASASSVAPPAQDSQGNTVTYDPGLAVDGDDATAWRVEGAGIGQFIQLDFLNPVRISELRLMPGYAKTDPFDGTDRFAQNRRIRRVRFEFSDGSSAEAAFEDERRLQAKALDNPAVTTFLRVVILETTDPGAADGRDFAPISEIVVVGSEQLG